MVPERAGDLSAMWTRLTEAFEGMPAVLRHGDLWRGNLLCARRRLTGVVDWDAWHPSGVPGADLLQLLGSERRVAARGDLGVVWRSQLWREPDAIEILARYGSRTGLRGGDPFALALSWWACEVAGNFRRAPHRAADERWLARNVHAVLDDVGG
jgi:aminoglycoside phosphotransferase (APT) family kinase protein